MRSRRERHAGRLVGHQSPQTRPPVDTAPHWWTKLATPWRQCGLVLAVKIGGLTSHPELNGCVGIVDQRDQGSQPSQTSQTSQVRWLVTVHCHQYSLAEDKLQVEPNPVGPVQVPPGTSGTPGTPAGTATANSNRLESNANEANQGALGEMPSQGDRPQSDPPQSTSQDIGQSERILQNCGCQTCHIFWLHVGLCMIMSNDNVWFSVCCLFHPQEAVVIDLETVPDEPRRESPAQESGARFVLDWMELREMRELVGSHHVFVVLSSLPSDGPFGFGSIWLTYQYMSVSVPRALIYIYNLIHIIYNSYIYI